MDRVLLIPNRHFEIHFTLWLKLQYQINNQNSSNHQPQNDACNQDAVKIVATIIIYGILTKPQIIIFVMQITDAGDSNDTPHPHRPQITTQTQPKKESK